LLAGADAALPAQAVSESSSPSAIGAFHGPVSKVRLRVML
jgi:hypothetical protein